MEASDNKIRICALISGHGSNMQSLLDAIDNQQINGEICFVVSDREDAPGLSIAKQRGIPTQIIPATQFADQHAFETKLIQAIKTISPDLIVLAGFMCVLSARFIQQFNQCIMNIHPSLLPKYKGLNTHQRVIDNKENIHGCSVHFVTPELDAGPLVIQEQVNVLEDDTARTLAKRVLEKEHTIYSLAVALFAKGRLKQKGNQCYLDDKALEQPLDSSVII